MAPFVFFFFLVWTIEFNHKLTSFYVHARDLHWQIQSLQWHNSPGNAQVVTLVDAEEGAAALLVSETDVSP